MSLDQDKPSKTAEAAAPEPSRPTYEDMIAQNRARGIFPTQDEQNTSAQGPEATGFLQKAWIFIARCLVWALGLLLVLSFIRMPIRGG